MRSFPSSSRPTAVQRFASGSFAPEKSTPPKNAKGSGMGRSRQSTVVGRQSAGERGARTRNRQLVARRRGAADGEVLRGLAEAEEGDHQQPDQEGGEEEHREEHAPLRAGDGAALVAEVHGQRA